MTTEAGRPREPWELRRGGAADRTWVGLSARLQRVAAARSGRTDLVVAIAPDIELGANAWSGLYHHELAEIRLPATSLLGLPPSAAHVDITVESGREAHPRLRGALLLASAHAAHTSWARPQGVDANLAFSLDVLERCRVARRALVDEPADRRWLTSVVAMFEHGPLAWLSITRLGFELAGVIGAPEAHMAREKLVEQLGVAGFQQLTDCLHLGLRLEDGADEELYREARLIARLLEQSGGATVSDGHHRRQGAPTRQKTSLAAARDDGSRAPTPKASVPREEDLLAAERQLARAAASETFGHGSVPNGYVTRQPSPHLIRSARAFAAALRRTRYRAADTTVAPSRTPPGRLRLAEAMRAQAQRAAGAALTARPWLKLLRRYVDEPPLTVGLSWDTSQSLSDLHSHMADLTWMLAWAIQRVDGRLAAVAWSSTTHAVGWPGRVPESVVEPPSGGRSSGCPQSLRALAGALDLDLSLGARIVVVVTDGRVPNRRAVRSEVQRLVRYGVTVVWVTTIPDLRPPAGAVPVLLSDPDTLGATLSHGICRALASSGN